MSVISSLLIPKRLGSAVSRRPSKRDCCLSYGMAGPHILLDSNRPSMSIWAQPVANELSSDILSGCESKLGTPCHLLTTINMWDYTAVTQRPYTMRWRTSLAQFHRHWISSLFELFDLSKCQCSKHFETDKTIQVSLLHMFILNCAWSVLNCTYAWLRFYPDAATLLPCYTATLLSFKQLQTC